MAETKKELDKKQSIQTEFSAAPEFFILHLDDEQELCDVFQDILKDVGVKVIQVKNGLEGLKIVETRAQNIAMIFSDIKMPEMDGFKFRDSILEKHANIPFAILSSHVDREMALKGVDSKICAFLGKPFQTEEIYEVLFKEAIPRIKMAKEDLELKVSFISDAFELIEESEEVLLALEQNYNDSDALNRFYAIMHTIKGASAFFEPKDLHHFVHSYEDILKKLQRSELSFSPQVMSILFRGFDNIKLLFSDFQNNSAARRDLPALLKVLDLNAIKDTPSAEVSEKPTASGQAPTTPGEKPKASEDIKVSVKLLDEFMQLSGEVTVIRNMLNKCVSSIEKRFAGDRDVGMLSELLSELHKINSGVQSKMAEIRKVPMKSVVKVLPRAVRDVAKSLNKKIDLQIEGDDLRVDTSIAEVLSNSLLHIIKNSLDHGIESTEERLKSGKPETGRISVEATSRDEKVIVKISDDGKGLSVEAIHNKLIKNGTHTREQVNEMSLAETYSMIFSSGFSTAQQVTEISGRGVGMSMVKDCVDAIGGRIVIDSNPGKGATFQLELPVPKSVLIASCLGVRVGARRFSFIQDDILKVFQFDSKQCNEYIKDLEQSEFLLWDNELLPIANLNELFNLSKNTMRESEFRRIIVMKSGQDNRKMAIEVTEILEVEDMVIKTLHNSLNQESYYRGVTFLDDGGVGLIINTNGLLDALHISREKAKSLNDKQNKLDLKLANEAKTPERNALILRNLDDEIFAIDQEQIFRIEELNSKDLKQSGSTELIPYRGGILRVESLDKWLNSEKKTAQSNYPEKLNLVVVKHGEINIGLKALEVLDMVPVENLKTELAQKTRFIEGHFFSSRGTVSMINCPSLCQSIVENSTPTQEEDALREAA